MMLLILDPSHGPRQVAALGSNQESLRLIRRGPAAMRAPQYQIVAIKGLMETKEQYQVGRSGGKVWEERAFNLRLFYCFPGQQSAAISTNSTRSLIEGKGK